MGEVLKPNAQALPITAELLIPKPLNPKPKPLNPKTQILNHNPGSPLVNPAVERQKRGRLLAGHDGFVAFRGSGLRVWYWAFK